MSETKHPDGISRRDFAVRVGAAAGLVAAQPLWRPTSAASLAASRVLGANDRVVVATIGIRSQGQALTRGFARLQNVEIKTLCDVDANLAPARVNDERLADVPTFKPRFEQDLRRVLDDKDIDAVVIATPNHWHALATVWALQAGKHVFVEKPVSHTVVEGRTMVDAARYYNRIVQAGTMNRSRPAVRKAIEFLRGGGIGRLYMARGLCFKPRPSIGQYPDGPMAPGEQFRLNVESTTAEPTYDEAYLARVDYDLWLGPAPKRPFNRNRFHYNWHWHWDYGDGDTGNQGPHQFDIARWGLGRNDHPVKVTSYGGYFGPPSSQETPDTQTSLFVYEDGTILEFATRGQHTNDEGTQKIGNLFYGTEGWLWIDGDGRKWQSYLGRKEEKGPGMDLTQEQSDGDPRVLTSTELPHYQNFIDAIRAGDSKLLNADILEGHMSAVLNHLANISYRLGRTLTFDGRTERFVNDSGADALLTREYRAGFELPRIPHGSAAL
ncbi:MAG TPA: Gfo/Idh/MocA family oxidoreductase [Vicinamibacterales bacterium]|nr:Gfo/Idh/MocA family oxidoreductase [Vicinamibacterales bacterium]